MMRLEWVLSVILVVGLCVGCGGKVSAPTDPAKDAVQEAPPPAEPTPVPESATEPAAQAPAPVEGSEAALLEKNCTTCHSLDRIKNFDHEEAWQAIVTRMIEKRNAPVSPEDAKNIVAYLDKTYPKK